MTSRSLMIVRPTLGAGGADRVTLTLLQHLDRRAFRPSLVLMRTEGVLLPDLPADVEVIDLGARNLWAAAGPLRQLLHERRPDVVFSSSSGTNISLAKAGCPSGTWMVLSERSGLMRRGRLAKRLALLGLKRAYYSRADRITAVSRGVARDLERRLALEASRIQVVDNPLLTAELPGMAAEPVDEPWFDGETPVLVAAGRLRRVKGFDDLVAALKRIRERRRCRLVILGEGPDRARLRARIARAGLCEHVKMPGFVGNPYGYMSRCRLFVLPSHNEGLPGVLVQAMACGAPVVATDCPYGPNEIVTHGHDGLLVPVASPDRLAAAIEELLEDSERRHALAAGGAQAGARFNLEPALATYARALTPEPA